MCKTVFQEKNLPYSAMITLVFSQNKEKVFLKQEKVCAINEWVLGKINHGFLKNFSYYLIKGWTPQTFLLALKISLPVIMKLAKICFSSM